MKRTQRIDAKQNVRKQRVSFLSIVVIAAMAVAAYLGLNYAARAIAKNSDRFYDSVGFRDAEIVSTLLLSPEDLDALRQTEGVADVEPMWQSSGTLSKDGVSKNAVVVSLTERINVPLLLSGRLPETEGECVVDQAFADALRLAEGDTVRIEGAQYLRANTFTVVGIALNADHAATEMSCPGNRNVVVLPSVFDREALDGCAMKALLRYADCAGLSRFDKSYFSAADDVAARIKALAEERPALRTEAVREEYGQQIAEGEAQLADAEQELADARQQLDDGWAELEDGEKQAADAEAQLADARQQLEDGEQLLDDGRQQLADAWDQLADALWQLTDGQVQLDDVWKVLADARQQLDDGWAEYHKNEALLADAWAQLTDGKAQLDDGVQQLEDAWTRLEAALWELNDGEARYADGAEQIRQAAIALDQANMGVGTAVARLEDGAAQLESAKTDVRNGIRTAVTAVFPGAAANIDWYEGASPNDSTLPITNSYAADLNLSLTDNIAALLNYMVGDGSITSAQLEDAATQIYGSLPEGSLAQAIAQYVVAQYQNYEAMYNELASGARQIVDGRQQLLIGGMTMEQAAYAYVAAVKELEAARVTLDEGWAAYEAGLAEYEEGKALLAEKTAEYEAGRAEYRAGADQLAEALALLSDNEAQYASGLAQYEAAKAELDDGWNQYNTGLGQYNEAKTEFDEKSGEYADGLAEYEQGTKDYADALEALKNGRAELEDGEARYAEGMADYLQGALALSDAKAQLDGLDECRWVILDPNGNASFQVIKADVQNVSDLAMTFALIFILVGALVIYATLGKIVEEQRRLVGATRALGFYKNEILDKYLFFGVCATVLGMLLGVAIGYFLIQPILTNGYGRFFIFDNSRRAFSPVATPLVLFGGFILSALAVVLACTDLLRSTATSLLQEKAPSKKQGKVKPGGSLYGRLILLNMRTDIQRVAVTIVSVAGCCALLVTGFSMRDGVMRSLDYRFDDILRFDYVAYIAEDDRAEALAAAQSALERAGASSVGVLTESQLYSTDGQISANTLFCGDLEELQPFLHCVQSKTGAALRAEQDGVWICSKVSEVSGLKAGDAITLYNGSMRPFEAPIAGVFEDYLARDMVMSPASYEHIYGAAPERNALLVKAGSMETAALEELLGSLPGVVRVGSNAQDRADMYSIASILNLISLLMVGIAAIMAFFIILNLINMQVHQKKRELTIMRVNGFTVRETIGYILRETIVTDILGIILGLGVGMLISYLIICLLEGMTARFVRTPQPIALILAVLITAGFSVVLNAIALRKIKYLKLTDVA